MASSIVPNRWKICTCLVQLIAALSLSACASNTPVATTQASTATVTGYDIRSGLADWESYSIYKVDGAFVNHSYWGSPADTKTSIPAGPHELEAHVYFNRSLFDAGPFAAYIPIKVQVIGGRRYRLRGEVVDDKAFVWLIDEESNSYASEKVGKAYRSAPSNPIPEELLSPNSSAPKAEETK